MDNKLNKTVVVGLSGGVDSAVSAYLLLKQGYNVIGLFMQNWDSTVNQENNYNSKFDVCDAQIDYESAKEVADYLKIPLHRVEFIKEYWDYVFSYFLDEYKNNRTPNPDVLCNKFIKFDSFLKYALENLHADYIAMGHYAKIVHEGNVSYLMQNPDDNKDQTYFLCQLTQEQLKHVLFPLGDLTKPEVRAIAKEAGLPNFDRKDSTGICFIGERDFRAFLENYLPNQPGEIIDISTNKVVGKHNGTMYYTIGQRKGLNLGGLNERYFVCAKDLENKIIYVAPNSQEAKYLDSNVAKVNQFNWIIEPDLSQPIMARFRHRQTLNNVKIKIIKPDEIEVRYTLQKNIVPGQYCVLYQNGKCLGGGVIDQTFNE